MSTIIEEIKSGNKDAVKAIYQEYAKDVFNFAKSITGDHDSALAATKKTFGKLISNIKKGEEPKEIRTSLLKIAYDEACNIAMPSLSKDAIEEPAVAEENVTEPVTEKVAPRKVRPARPTKPVDIEETTPEHEAIYMPKGPLQVEETMEETVEEFQEMPRKRRPEGEAPRRRRPVAEGEEAPRRKKSFVEAEETEMEDIPRKRKSMVNEVPVALEEEEIEDFEEEYEAPKPKKKARPVREESPVDVYDALDEETEYDDQYDDDEEELKPHHNKGLFLICILLNVVLILVLLWFLGGLLVNLGVLPEMDLGYSWFNNTIYPLF